MHYIFPSSSACSISIGLRDKCLLLACIMHHALACRIYQLIKVHFPAFVAGTVVHLRPKNALKKDFKIDFKWFILRYSFKGFLEFDKVESLFKFKIIVESSNQWFEKCVKVISKVQYTLISKSRNIIFGMLLDWKGFAMFLLCNVSLELHFKNIGCLKENMFLSVHSSSTQTWTKDQNFKCVNIAWRLSRSWL